MPQDACQSPIPHTFDLVRSPLAGINLIDASAGTGKTYTICGLVLRLLLEKQLPIEQILVVTYTEAATEDLRDRIRQQLRQALDGLSTPAEDEFLQKYLATLDDPEKAAGLLSDALRSFDEAAIYTIHGFCHRMLLENSFESNTLFDTELIPDDSHLVQELTEDFWRRTATRISDLFSQYAAKELSPEKLGDFLGPLLPHPFVRFIPALDAAASCGNLSEIETAYQAAYRDICLQWPRVRSVVCDDLQNSGSLNRRTYHAAAVADLVRDMDAMAASCLPSLELADRFELLTAYKIKACTRKNKTPHILPFHDDCENLVTVRDELLGRYDNCLLALKKSLLDSIPRELNIRKDRDNVFAFDDLLRRLHGALNGKTGSLLARAIAQKYPAALIDEFQDTDPLQYEIFKNIYSGDDLLFLIGDPKQAIYSFRGADIHTYMDAARQPHLHHHTLGVNYRSDPQLVKAVNTFFCRVRNPFIFKAISFQPAAAPENREQESLTIEGRQQPPFVLSFLERDQARNGSSSTKSRPKKITKAEARETIISQVTAEISRLLQLAAQNRACINSRKLAPGDIAILVRTNNEARKMQQALTSSRIASVLHSGDDLFSSEEAREMRLLLEAIAAPNNIRKLKTALLTCFFSLQADALDLMQPDNAANVKIIELWLARFRTYHEMWQRYGFIRMFWTVMQENQVRQRLLASENGERALTNILHLAEVLHQEAVTRGLSMTALLGYLENRLADDRPKNIEHQLRLESDEDRVKIVTIHKAKGLEYPVVFCPFSWEGTRLQAAKACLFHLPSKTGRTEPVYDAGSPDLEKHLQKARQEELAENLRLLYVALTRAVHRCYFYWGPINGAETSAPAYLLHQVADPEISTGADSIHYDLMQRVAASFSGLSDREILADLQNLAAASDAAITITAAQQVPDSYTAPREEMPTVLQCREFTGTIRDDWKISSFSSLTRPGPSLRPENYFPEDTVPDRDPLPAASTLSADVPESHTEEYTIFTFPSGARAGTFLHELLELADFTLSAPLPESLILQKLQNYGYDADWYPVLVKLLDNLGDIELHKDVPGLKLARIPRENCLHELEFYYPISHLTAEDLQDIFHTVKLPFAGENSAAVLAQQLDRFHFDPGRGFMRGFIDLVFEFKGKYYLADWKSNHLGPNLNSYSQEKLLDAILSGFYFLQYHLYSLALHLYLEKRLPGYVYNTHFGGVFYLFLRGISKDFGPDCGIYYDLPDFTIIERLRTKLISMKQP